MKELVKFEESKNQIVVSSLDIAENFGKDHKHVLRDIKNLIGGVQNWADLFYETTYVHPQNKQQYPMFLMNRDGFSLLVMGFTGKDALDWKVKYIGAFNEMENKLNSPEFIVQRAMAIMKQKCDALLLENKELEQKVEEDKPKVIFADAVANSNELVLVRDLAKIIKQNGIGIGGNRLWAWMRGNGYICQGSCEPTQKSMELGLFKVIVRTIEDGQHSPKVTRTTKVTQKGVQYFVNKFLNNN